MEPSKKLSLKTLGIWSGIGTLLVIGIAVFGAPANLSIPAVSANAQVTPSQPAAVVQAVVPVSPPVPAPVITPAPVVRPATIPVVAQPAQSAPVLSNNNQYTNVNGTEVHSPAYSNDNSVPKGATALCGDGTYSFSQHRNGTCSHHGGVKQRLR
jgi:hypothetical protein